jgi:hypothetical protein
MQPKKSHLCQVEQVMMSAFSRSPPRCELGRSEAALTLKTIGHMPFTSTLGLNDRDIKPYPP